MSRHGFPNLGIDYTGFLHKHQHPASYKNVNPRHVIVDIEDWEAAQGMYSPKRREIERMSKVNVIIDGKHHKSVRVESISFGTYFTGNIGSFEESSFLKGRDRIISLTTTKQWLEGTIIENYQECDAEIRLTSIK